MQFMGSKNRLAKHLLPCMLATRANQQTWVEPFVGGGNMIDKVTGPRMGNDIDPYLIALLQSVQNGYIPPSDVSEALYQSIKKNPENYPAELVGFVGFGCSFGGKWFNGYARNTKKDNYAKRAANSLMKQAPKLTGVQFTNGSYLDLNFTEKCLIYCDPPYANTTRYRYNIDYVVFWDWCRSMANLGHTVFISSYEAPNDFECVLELHESTKLNKNQRVPRIEKLFRKCT